jgi:hypothetical protein
MFRNLFHKFFVFIGMVIVAICEHFHSAIIYLFKGTFSCEKWVWPSSVVHVLGLNLGPPTPLKIFLIVPLKAEGNSDF